MSAIDFEVQRCTRQCAATGRQFEAGETFYSVLVAEGANVARHDYSQAAWTGPPEDVLGWWKSQMPEPNARRIHWAPNDVMLELLDELESQPAAADMRYILTLLLIRRRVLRLEETEHDEHGREQLVVYCHKRETTLRVPVAPPSAPRTAEIQEALARLLFAGGKSE